MAIELYDFGNKSKLYTLLLAMILKEKSSTLDKEPLHNKIELDQYQGLKMCKAYSVAYTELVERGRIFKFLHGLNFENDPI
ncbi:hypothetical protein CR513_40701, partial [Mucuna pruriens]